MFQESLLELVLNINSLKKCGLLLINMPALGQRTLNTSIKQLCLTKLSSAANLAEVALKVT